MAFEKQPDRKVEPTQPSTEGDGFHPDKNQDNGTKLANEIHDALSGFSRTTDASQLAHGLSKITLSGLNSQDSPPASGSETQKREQPREVAAILGNFDVSDKSKLANPGDKGSTIGVEKFNQLSVLLNESSAKLSPAEFTKLIDREIASENAAGNRPSLRVVERDAQNNIVKLEASGSDSAAVVDKSIVVYDKNNSDKSGFLVVNGLNKENISDFRDQLVKEQAQFRGNVMIRQTDASPPKYSVLIRKEGDLRGKDDNASHNPLVPISESEQKIFKDVTKAFTKNGQSTKLSYEDQLKLIADCAPPKDFLRKNSNLSPLIESGQPDPLFSETLTQSQEQILIKALNTELAAKPNATISMGHLAELALKASDNDTTLALLTMTNFSKNVASIERRQSLEQYGSIPPQLKDSYDAKLIDNIFNHLQNFSDSTTDAYNKEGAFYHFWGAAYASHIMSPALAETAVGLEMFMNGHEPIEYGSGLAGSETGMIIPQIGVVDQASTAAAVFDGALAARKVVAYSKSLFAKIESL